MGGHVIFSHYDYFDQLIDTAVGTGILNPIPNPTFKHIPDPNNQPQINFNMNINRNFLSL
jgi:hypothetical protein